MDVVQTSPFFSDIFAVKIIKKKSVIDSFIKTHPIHYFNGEKIDILQDIRKNQ
jgi:hypothetical protein